MKDDATAVRSRDLQQFARTMGCQTTGCCAAILEYFSRTRPCGSCSGLYGDPSEEGGHVFEARWMINCVAQRERMATLLTKCSDGLRYANRRAACARKKP